MLLSMTGFGDARVQDDRLAVTVEIRSVNNRHLKISARVPATYLTLESDLEKLVRRSIERGTVNVTMKVRRLDGRIPFSINSEVLQQYWQQLRALADQMHMPPPGDLSTLIELPGVITEDEGTTVDANDWPLISEAVTTALGRLREFRLQEGASMRDELLQLCGRLLDHAERTAARAPQVIVEFRNRLRDRVNELMRDSGLSVTDADLIREVSLFSDRCDIHEELTRLRCHIDQFRTFLSTAESTGRRLDFLCQELFREVNTIGSKANNVDISHEVVEAKAVIEKMREIVQNVE